MLLAYLLHSILVFARLTEASYHAPDAHRQATLSSGSTIQTLELASISSQFTSFSHPLFPGRSARIKKSDFCDGGVNTYTGYIDVGVKHYFFYFFESREDPFTDDVLLWTNGGPGASSALGLFLELGKIKTANSTTYNPYAWNSKANIFFIDQPTGVGFSYQDSGTPPSSTEEVAADIAAFIATFFETFSEFRGRNFHLTGESYAGRYLPVYAAQIYDQNRRLLENNMTPINLKSVVIGNGATNWFYLVRSYYDAQCTDAMVPPPQPINACIRMKQALPRCERWTKAACENHFDLIDCAAAFRFCGEELAFPYDNLGLSYFDMTNHCNNNDNSCYPGRENITLYLNSTAVRSAIGADDAAGPFIEHAEDIRLRFWAHGDVLHRNELYVAELLQRSIKILIYAGELDFIANWVGNMGWTLDMEWHGQEGFRKEELREWMVDGRPVGKTRSYGGLTFATIRGAGHLAPYDKPAETLEMINRWLADSPL